MLIYKMSSNRAIELVDVGLDHNMLQYLHQHLDAFLFDGEDVSLN